jgi:hypothetical protein
MKQDSEYYRRKSVHAAAERVLTQTFGGLVLLPVPMLESRSSRSTSRSTSRMRIRSTRENEPPSLGRSH